MSEKKNCDTCGGSGQISFFQGVSRFLLTMEDCPACDGLGYILPEKEEKHEPRLRSDKPKK